MPSTAPCGALLYAATAQAPSDRGPRGLPVVEPCGPMGTIVENRSTSVQRPLARQRVMLSRRVHAYYGLIRASGYPPTMTYGFRHRDLHARGTAQGGITRGSPIYSAWLYGHAVSPTPVAPRRALGCRFPRGTGLRPDIRGSASTLEFSRLQSSLYATAWPLASPPQEDIYFRAFVRRVA